MKKVILHIGLPKTATTLLQQHIFPKLHLKIDCIGIKQPREQLQDPLYCDIWKLVCTEKNEYIQGVDLVKSYIRSRLNSNNKPFILSEECFCLDTGKVSWQEKLNRLANIFKEYDIQILVTVRNPITAIYSYYVQVSPLIKSKYPDLVGFSNKSNLAKIYDYEYLDSVIKISFGNTKINYIPFELLKTKRFLPEIFNLIGIDGRFDLVLPNTNSKKKSKHGVKTHYKRNILSYFVFILRIPLISNFVRLPIINSVLKRPLALLKNLKMPMSSVTINNPTQQELAQLNKRYSKSISFINSKINFNYE